MEAVTRRGLPASTEEPAARRAEKARASVRRAVLATRKCLMSCRMRRRWKSDMRIRPCKQTLEAGMKPAKKSIDDEVGGHNNLLTKLVPTEIAGVMLHVMM